MNRRILAVTIATVLVPIAAAAEDQQPSRLPTRDVDVTYRSQPGGPAGPQPIEQRSRFSATIQRTRLDLPTPGLFSIMDYRSRTLSIVSQADRKVLETRNSLPVATPEWVRVGTDEVAGLPCTEWQARDSVGQPAITCFTSDGVLLRARRGPQVLAVATRVSYALQPADLFVVPADFDRVQRPAPGDHPQ